MAEDGTRFVLKRLSWSEQWGGKWVRQPGEVRLTSFATFEEAEAERARREGEMRKKVNPFDCGAAVHYWTHLDEPRLRDWLMDHGVEPPKPNKDGTTNWSAWWKKSGKKLPAEKRAAIWEALDKVRFFAVREEPARPVGFAVLRINWEYNDEFYDANDEGGEVVKVYRSRERAEEECEALNFVAREQWGDMGYDNEFEDEDDDYEYGMFDMRSRLHHRRGLAGGDKLAKGEGVFKSAATTPFYEVIEVELEGLK